jgi:cytosine/adenosine deaminase-related metal-dependent hydrolase
MPPLPARGERGQNYLLAFSFQGAGMSVAISWGARWIVPIDRPPLQDAALTIRGGRIAEIIPGGRSRADRDLGEVAILPGLVNAHTHLEFSSLTEPLGYQGIPLTMWILEVVGWRAGQSPADRQQAVRCGLQESTRCQTACLGEIATAPWFHDTGLRHGPARCCFVERLGTDPHDSDKLIAEGKRWLADYSETGHALAGISPHAPYSLSDRLLNGLIQWAVDDGLPVAMHLAESRDELQWLQSGDGPFRDLLETLRVPVPQSSGRRPLHYLQALARATCGLVIHGNYLAADELDFVARHRNLHLVYCPRTHAWFGHDRWPLRDALRRRINVAVGTDSRASNPDLNVLEELRQIRRSFPGLSPKTILEMGTINGARALQRADQLGTLSPGKVGEFLALPVPPTDDPCEAVLRATADDDAGPLPDVPN